MPNKTTDMASTLPATNWLNSLHNFTDNIRHMAAVLENIAQASCTCGNYVLADKLGMIAGVLFQSSDSIGDAVGACLKEQFDRSHQHSATILQAVLAGIELTSQEQPTV